MKTLHCFFLGSGGRRTRRALWAALVGAFLPAGGLRAADGPVDLGGAAPPQARGSNESLDPAPGAAHAPAGVRRAAKLEEKPRESSAESNDDGDSVREPARAHMVTRHLAPQSMAASSATAETPWYRTGFGALCVVLAAVAAAYVVVRKWVPTVRTPTNGLIRVVARAALTPKHHVALVQVGRRLIAVGVSPDRIDTLCEIDDCDETALSATGRTAAEPRAGRGFAALLAGERADYPAQGDSTRVTEGGGDPRGAPGGRPLADLKHRLHALRSR